MNLGIVIGIIGILVSLIGIPIAYVVARRSRQLPDLRHAIDFDVILNPDDRLLDHDLSMRIGNRSINSISRSRVVLWNHRGDTIRGGDIVDSDPLRIQFTEGDIALQVRTLRMSRSQTKLTPTINPADEASVDISFDFLDAGDGAIFEIVHQGPNTPTLLGTIRGVKIRNCGNANLGPETLAATKMSLFRSFLDLAPPRVQTNVILNFFAGLMFAIFAIICAVKSTASAHLVSAYHYNLRTITGQAYFANAVLRSNPNAVPYLILIIIFSFGAVYQFILLARSVSPIKFPSSVAALIVDDNMQGVSAGDALPSEPSASPESSNGESPKRSAAITEPSELGPVLRLDESALAGHDDDQPVVDQQGYGPGHRAARHVVLLDERPLRWQGPARLDVARLDLLPEHVGKLDVQRHHAEVVDSGHVRQPRRY